MTGTREEKRAYWARHVKAWKASGETQRNYCQQHQLKPHRLAYWNQALKPRSETTSTPVANGFLPVHVNSPAVQSQGLSIRFPSGVRVEGIQSDTLALTREIIGWLA